jgi:hypothetical protein
MPKKLVILVQARVMNERAVRLINNRYCTRHVLCTAAPYVYTRTTNPHHCAATHTTAYGETQRYLEVRSQVLTVPSGVTNTKIHVRYYNVH